MSTNKCILLIGACGSGKTWVMQQLIGSSKTISKKFGLFRFRHDPEINVLYLGIYDNSTFQGSDRLSMAVMKDSQQFKQICDKENFSIIAEGDRFTNQTFINTFNPIIVKIHDHGAAGRLKRGSNQTERQIKSIATRVKNISAHHNVQNSSEALAIIKNIIQK
jgi:hypothetical protein